MEFPEDRLYSEAGFWVKLDDDIATIGISPMFIYHSGGVGQIGYDETSDDEILVILVRRDKNPKLYQGLRV